MGSGVPHRLWSLPGAAAGAAIFRVPLQLRGTCILYLVPVAWHLLSPEALKLRLRLRATILLNLALE